MWLPKSCTRCGFDLYKTVDPDGEVLSCLQCGREVLANRRRPELSAAEAYALFHEDDLPDLAA